MRAVFLLTFMLAFGSTTFAQTLYVNHQVANTGDTVYVHINADNLTNVGAFTLFLSYDSLVLEYDSVVNIHAGATGMVFNAIGSSSQVGLAWSATNQAVDFSGITICQIRFIYLGNETALDFTSDCEIADFGASILNVNYQSGSVASYFEAEISGLADHYCVGTNPIDLEGTPLGGVFYVDGVFQTVFDPSIIGVYEVSYVFTNTWGYSDTAVQVLEVHELPVISATIDSISCFQASDGLISIDVVSGNPPYLFSWSNGESTQEIAQLSAGTYSLTLSDTWCDVMQSYILEEPEALQLTMLPEHCSDILISDGSILADVSGGTEPYQILWSNAETTLNIENLSEGIYSISVLDNHSCQLEDSIYLRAWSSQQLNLPSQWSLFSFNIEPEPNDLDSILLSIIPNLEIVKAELGGVYWPAFSVDQIHSFGIGEAYQMKLIALDTLYVAGYYLHPEDYPIELAGGWSFLGYLRTSEATIVSMLSSIVGQIVIVKDSQGATYWPAYSLDLIGNMKPGGGYQINMQSPAVLTYPANN